MLFIRTGKGKNESIMFILTPLGLYEKKARKYNDKDLSK
jgi:hypothetical protein